jgi:hypothetical protein
VKKTPNHIARVDFSPSGGLRSFRFELLYQSDNGGNLPIEIRNYIPNEYAVYVSVCIRIGDGLHSIDFSLPRACGRANLCVLAANVKDTMSNETTNQSEQLMRVGFIGGERIIILGHRVRLLIYASQSWSMAMLSSGVSIKKGTGAVG